MYYELFSFFKRVIILPSCSDHETDETRRESLKGQLRRLLSKKGSKDVERQFRSSKSLKDKCDSGLESVSEEALRLTQTPKTRHHRGRESGSDSESPIDLLERNSQPGDKELPIVHFVSSLLENVILQHVSPHRSVVTLCWWSRSERP